jgi:hypothetical protein
MSIPCPLAAYAFRIVVFSSSPQNTNKTYPAHRGVEPLKNISQSKKMLDKPKKSVIISSV